MKKICSLSRFRIGLRNLYISMGDKLWIILSNIKIFYRNILSLKGSSLFKTILGKKIRKRSEFNQLNWKVLHRDPPPALAICDTAGVRFNKSFLYFFDKNEQKLYLKNIIKFKISIQKYFGDKIGRLWLDKEHIGLYFACKGQLCGLGAGRAWQDWRPLQRWLFPARTLFPSHLEQIAISASPNVNNI